MTHCIFCQDIEAKHILTSSQFFFVVLDIDPIQVGHLLIISKEHITNIKELSEEKLIDLILLEKKLVSILEENFHLLGVSVIQNNGQVMDEGTHFHVHIVPRYHNDGFWDNQRVKPTELDMTLLRQQLKTT